MSTVTIFLHQRPPIPEGTEFYVYAGESRGEESSLSFQAKIISVTEPASGGFEATVSASGENLDLLSDDEIHSAIQTEFLDRLYG